MCGWPLTTTFPSSSMYDGLCGRARGREGVSRVAIPSGSRGSLGRVHGLREHRAQRPQQRSPPPPSGHRGLPSSRPAHPGLARHRERRVQRQQPCHGSCEYAGTVRENKRIRASSFRGNSRVMIKSGAWFGNSCRGTASRPRSLHAAPSAQSEILDGDLRRRGARSQQAARLAGRGRQGCQPCGCAARAQGAAVGLSGSCC
jgi:hypothetical protein